MIDDATFDALLPDEVRRLSSVHWTPVDVALRATAWLAPEPNARVLDAGAGPGKVCCIGALSRGGSWLGVERDPALVDVAMNVARVLGVADRTEFRAGELFAFDWNAFDGVYLYNPFELHPDANQIARTEARLADLRAGVRVVTFHGFGGVMPPNLERVDGDEHVAMWISTRG